MSQLFVDEDELEYANNDGSGGGRGLRGALVVVVVCVALLAAVVVGGGLWARSKLDPAGEPGQEVTVTVPAGATTADIADLLEEQGVVPSATAFRAYLRVAGADPFHAGDYVLRRNSAVWDVRDTLSAGPQVDYTRITIPEGLTLEEIAARVDEHERYSGEAFTAAVTSGQIRSRYQPPEVTTLQGLLLPETYTLAEGQDEVGLVQQMVAAFDGTADELGYTDAQARVGLTPYETIVVASLIEEEARVPEDRAKISRVIHNRLADGMRLQIDATVIFAHGERREGGRVLYSDLEIDSPYNTYKYAGLPPTPIAAPGRAALEAAINPADGPWLYYVKYEEDGSHAFSTTLAEHNERIAEAKEKGVNP